MLGVFALVVMTSVLDGVKDKVSTGFAGMSWDGTLVLVPRQAKTSEEQKRFAMSTGLRYEDLARIDRAASARCSASRRAPPSAAWCSGAGGTERIFVNGVTADYYLPDEPPHRPRPRPHRGRPAAALDGGGGGRDARLQALRRQRSGGEATW